MGHGHAHDGSRRLDGAVRRGRPITLLYNGRPLAAHLGESVAAALVAAGEETFRLTARRREPRGLFCGMGVCYDCLATIDGRPGVRTCMTLVRDGMRVTLQDGWGDAADGPDDGAPAPPATGS
jgi:predicted molibdopterin-dependent oxidoreductase YjgC